MTDGQPPGGPSRAIRVALLVVLALVGVYLLFTQVFPRIAEIQDDPALGAPLSAAVLRA